MVIAYCVSGTGIGEWPDFGECSMFNVEIVFSLLFFFLEPKFICVGEVFLLDCRGNGISLR